MRRGDRPTGAIGLEPGLDLVERARVDLVPALLRLAAHAHELGLAQHPQVLGHARLAQAEQVDELANGPGPLAQQIEDAPASGLGHDVEGVVAIGMIIPIRLYC